jgi:para-nitrobenzyl esterase
MADAFIAFAKNGTPGTRELPWPAYNPSSKPTMVFDIQSGVKNDPDRDLLSRLPQGAGGRGRGL